MKQKMLLIQLFQMLNLLVGIFVLAILIYWFLDTNINSLRTKFDFLCDQIEGSIDVFMISESKLDGSFPHGQFLIGGFYTPFRFDRKKNGGAILIYVWEDIPAKILSHDFPSTESFFC